MKVCFLITGILRNFSETLYPFLLELQEYMDFDMYIYTSNESLDTHYIHFEQTKKEKILENPRCKLLTYDNTILPLMDNYREKEKNTFYQWHKIYKCFQFLPKNEYDYIVRIRPDVKFLISAKAFSEVFVSLQSDKLYIPTGNDMIEKKGLNDQIAIGDYKTMSIYASFYIFLNENTSQPIVSELLLHSYIQDKVNIERISTPYNLYLSDCLIVAVTGDSGVGKSTIVNSIQKVFPFDSSLTLETDRYHKWERNDENWKSYTHLHPEANHLEKLIDDTFHLKLGDSVCVVDYDHSTGKFTAPQAIEPKQIILLCGLHSLAKERLRNEIDIRIYIDTEQQLKRYWKVSRDLQKRNRTVDSIVDSIEKRQVDYKTYIEPQKEYANLIFHYWYDGDLPDYNTPLLPEKLRFTIECKVSLLSYVSHLLYEFSSQFKKINRDTMLFNIQPDISKEKILDFIRKESIEVKSVNDIDDSYLGICQLLVLCLLT